MRKVMLFFLLALVVIVPVAATAEMDEAAARAKISELCAPDDELFRFPVPVDVERKGIAVRLYAERTLDGERQRLRLMRVRDGKERECVGVAIEANGGKSVIVLRRYQAMFREASQLFQKKLRESEGKNTDA